MAGVIRTTLIILQIWMVVFGKQTHHCKKRIQVLCGDNKCCCQAEGAVCKDFGVNLTYIPRLPEITRLYFDNNSLPDVRCVSFANLSTVSKITFLSLTYNKIAHISPNAFSSFDCLQTLILDGNSEADTQQLLVALGRIQKSPGISISLQDTGILHLEDDVFRNLINVNVTGVSLGKNKIDVFNVKAFQTLAYLERITLDRNEIREIRRDGILTGVTHLDLSDNQLVGNIANYTFCSEKNGIPMFPNIKQLILMGNFIGAIQPHSLHCLDSLEKLNLNRNVIKIVENNVFAYLYNLKELQFAYMHKSILKINDYAFNNSNVYYINFRENYMILQPDTAKTIFRHSRNLKRLDISLMNMKRLSPEQVLNMLSPLKSLEKLTATRCQIIKIADNFLKSLPNLTDLNLDGNSIHGFGTPFKNVYSLRTLSLQGNAFTVIKEEDVTHNFMTSLEKINLADNPFDCTCSLLWFRSMITGNKTAGKFGSITLVAWPYRYECMTPTSLMKTDLENYRPTKESCANLLLILIISFASFIVLVTIVSAVVFRYRWYIRYWFYKMRTKRIDPENAPLLRGDKDPRYDGYIIYNINDSYFVHYDLRAIMEDKCRYTLHIWERDGAVGGSKIEAMVDGIYTSQNAVAVISKNSLHDNWVQFQIDVAMDRQVALKKDFLMLVILDDVDYQKLNKYWCVMFTKMRSATWSTDDDGMKCAVFEKQMTRYFGEHLDHAIL